MLHLQRLKHNQSPSTFNWPVQLNICISLYSHLSTKVVPQVSLLQSLFLESGHGQDRFLCLGEGKSAAILKLLLLKACNGIHGAAPHRPKLVFLAAQYT